MAELLTDKGYEAPGSLGVHLREALTDEYTVVCEPVVHGHQLDAVVVGPDGLVVLQAKDWEGEIRPTRGGAWKERLASGKVVSHPNPGVEVKRAAKTLRAFLKDEFPSLRPGIHHFVVLTRPDAKLAVHGATDPPCAKLDDLAREIASLAPMRGQAPLPSDVRGEFAVALLDRQLTTTQRASQPFIFRSGHLLGIGKKAWTIRDVIKHMDKYPDDSVHHLRNGTLERWFADEGAMHLAALAQEVVRESTNDPRVSLESFLLRSGLVGRPRFASLPKRIDVGRALSGKTVVRRLRCRKRRGRGYLFGTVRPTDPWARVDPDVFGGSLDAVVSVDTASLLITKQPHQTKICVDSSASDEPVDIPVRVWVVSMPSALSRYLVRPLAGLVAAGLLGAGIGWSLGRFGVQAPGWLTGISAEPVSSGMAWMVLTGLFWGLLGAIRGFSQHPAWPTAYAMGRWLLKSLFWGAVLLLLVTAVLWFEPRFYAVAGLSIPDRVRMSIILVGVALAVLPATVGEIWSARPGEDASDASSARRTSRRALWGVIGVALVFVMLASMRLVGPLVDRHGLDTKAVSIQQWARVRWTAFEGGLNDFVDQLYVRYYDRRAGTRATPTPSQPSGPSAKTGRIPWPWKR